MKLRLGEWTTDELAACCRTGRVVVLVPVGSVEPHGPHLPLDTDAVISETAALRAAEVLTTPGCTAVVAPIVPYGVTNFAEGFAGAVSVRAETLTMLLRDIADSLLRGGLAHVCFVNNHLEPAHDAAVRASVAGMPKGAASVACPLSRRWGRTLSDEYKSGACHAGRYETSLVLASGREVRAEYMSLSPLEVSLSAEIQRGHTTFREMGLERAYTGAPAQASVAEGEALYEKLVTMIVTEVREALGATDDSGR